MESVIIYGPPQSSYVRTARMACVEKGVAHELVAVALGSEPHRAMHPFAKVPVLRHGEVQIYETSAICRYIDDAFSGPSLTPSDSKDRAVMETWISNVNSYLYPDMVKDYVLQYVFPRGENGTPDREKIDATLPKIKIKLGIIEAALQGRDFLAGSLSLADLFLAPLLSVLTNFPEGKDMIGEFTNIQRAGAAMTSRASYTSTAT